jgi:hypothetical protein
MTTAVTAQRNGYGFGYTLGCYGITDIDKALLAYPPKFPLYAFAVFSKQIICIHSR